jgi:LysM repeat protein
MSIRRVNIGPLQELAETRLIWHWARYGRAFVVHQKYKYSIRSQVILQLSSTISALISLLSSQLHSVLSKAFRPHRLYSNMKPQALTTVILLAVCSLQALALPAAQTDTITPLEVTIEGTNPGVVAKDLNLGEALNLPRSASSNDTTSNGTSTSAATYTVVSGDTFDVIASKESTTTQQLEDANPGVSPADLQVGEILNLPSSASANGTR